jgi:hypothetical protein
MTSQKLRLFVVAVAASLAFANVAEAAPVAAIQIGGAMSPILPAFVAHGHGGGRGGYHGGVPGGGGHGGYHHGGYRGGHNTVVVGGRGAWGRGYRWAPGGAIAAGAAIGFIAAAGAVAYATTQPPAPGLCWYYTDPSRRAGFWDVCP